MKIKYYLLGLMAGLCMCNYAMAQEVNGEKVLADSTEMEPVVVSRTRKRGMDRGITQTVFVPKGSWLTGATFSYSEHENDNYRFLMVVKDISTKGYSFKVSPYAAYFFANNMAAGVYLAYSRTFLDLKNAELDLGDDLSFKLQDLSYLEYSYSGTAFLRTYVSLGSSKVFGLFNDTRVTYGFGQGRITSGVGETMEGTFQQVHNLQVGFAPGLTAFINNYTAAEVSVGVMGFDFKWIEQKTNQVVVGKRTTSSGDFKVNLFTINIGITFYL